VGKLTARHLFNPNQTLIATDFAEPTSLLIYGAETPRSTNN
jgi:hypothetical protein